MKCIFSIIPSLKNEVGHFFEYNLALTKAAKKNKFKHIKIIPKTSQVPNMDESWEKSIYELDHKNRLKNLKNLFAFIRIFRRIKKESSPIIFLEDFTLIVLLLLFLASFVVRPKAELWLFQRFEYNKTFLEGKGYKFIQNLLEKLFGKQKVKYLTDSDLIANINGYFFNRKFQVFPIPHTYSLNANNQKNSKFKYFWWPGGLIRKEKGLDNIQKILKQLNKNSNIKIVVADVGKSIFSSDNTLFIPTNLSRKDYEDWMVKSDLILLPYISTLYRYRTSGIFVEAIIANTFPVVSKNTWMSYELTKHNLDELALDWSSSNIIDQLEGVLESENIEKKFSKMREVYINEHSIENYAKVLK